MPETLKKMDKVSRKILEDAQREVDKILEDGRRKAKEIKEDALRKRSGRIKEAKLEAGDRYSRVFDLEVAKARSEMEQKILMQKITIIDSIIEKSVSEIVAGNPGKYEGFLKETIKNLNISKAFYQLGSGEDYITDSMIKKIAQDVKLERSGEPADFKNGIKIIDGKTEYSISAETLIQTNNDDIRMELAKFLFEEG